MKTIMMLIAFVPIVAAAQSVAVNTYTFTGRIMDARHAGFDNKRTATISGKDAASGALLASSTTFFYADSRRNYSLHIPMSTGSAAGFATNGAPLKIIVKDDTGNEWSGLVADSDAGAPGQVREVDIVLATDGNRDGIADELYELLQAEWEDSDYWADGETFDPLKDYDGDGVSTINEAFTGTNPFDPADVLRITEFVRTPATGAVRLSFEGLEGRSYSVQTATDLKVADWSATDFTLQGAEATQSAISFLTGTRTTPTTVYLTPTGSSAFFRIKAE